MPRVRHKLLDCSPGCPVEGVLHLIDGKWKGVILYHLLDGTMRFNEFGADDDDHPAHADQAVA